MAVTVVSAGPTAWLDILAPPSLHVETILKRGKRDVWRLLACLQEIYARWKDFSFRWIDRNALLLATIVNSLRVTPDIIES